MRKGQKKRIWAPEQKLEIVRKHLEEHISVRALEREYRAEHSMICRWVKEYIAGGEGGLASKKRPGNKFAALHRSKKLSELERLRLLVAKQEIEIARLKKRILGGRSWYKQGIRYWTRCEYAIIDEMKEKYPVVFLCRLMGVSKSGYYKWKGRQGKLNRYEQDRQLLTTLLSEQHQKHPSHGYHMLAEDVFRETGWIFSHNLAHKCCKEAGIHSKARKYRYKKKKGEEHIKFANVVDGNWNAERPVQIVVSDMTVFKNNGKNWEWTLLVDTFNNEILAHKATPVTGSNKPYYHCLEVLKKLAGKKNEEQQPQIVFHTDQGSVYSSQAFCQAHEHYNILRSMSKAGTPTDNAIIEALNGWIKEELYLDFALHTAENVPALLDEYVHYFNYNRPAAALGYKSPVQYKTELGF